jgi:hypothetical protein
VLELYSKAKVSIGSNDVIIGMDNLKAYIMDQNLNVIENLEAIDKIKILSRAYRPVKTKVKEVALPFYPICFEKYF